MAQTDVTGTEDGAVPGSVRYVGRDQDGELYALTANKPIPAGNTGEVHQIVPPDEEGEDGASEPTETETQTETSY